MALSDMVIFNEYIMPATYEELGQRIEAFNNASNGAIVLTREGFEGDLFERSFYNSLASAQRSGINRYGANNTVTPVALTQDKDNAVKIAAGFGPVLFEPSQMTWLRKNVAEATVVISGQMANLMLQDQLNTVLNALVGAIGNQADATLDVSATSGINYSALNKTHALFGDMSGNLIAQVMAGSTYHKLVGQNIDNNNSLFSAGNVTIIDILGKRSIITDSPALIDSTKERVLALSSSAGVVMDGGDMITNLQTNNGKDRIETTFQADYSYGLNLKGYRWNGAKSPSQSDLGTGTNWEKVVNSIKHSAGAITIGDATKDA